MSEYKFHGDVLKKLIEHYRNEPDALEMIHDCLKTFSSYHAAIMEMEVWLKLYGYDNMDKTSYQDRRVSLDQARTVCHNAVISSVNILNRMAAAAGVGTIYDGPVSEESPIRRQVGDGVLDWVAQTIRERL